MEPTAVNQLWVADITYIRLREEFVYLAVVLDAYSRRVIGWALGRTLEAELGRLCFAHGACFAGGQRPAWCIIPIAACSMHRRTTRTSEGT